VFSACAEVVQNASGPLLVEIDKLPGNPLGISLAQGSYRGRRVLYIDSVAAASIADRSVNHAEMINIAGDIEIAKTLDVGYPADADAKDKLINVCPVKIVCDSCRLLPSVFFPVFISASLLPGHYLLALACLPRCAAPRVWNASMRCGDD